MTSSDDEDEPVAQLVTNYYFVDEKEEPIPFSVLPIQWSGVKNPDSIKRQVFLHGIADDGLQKIYKQVKAWKFELLDEQPKILVLSRDNNWITLQKPRKSFDDIVRTTLITVQWLAILKKNVEIGGKSLWDQLQKVFSSYVLKPTENDLLEPLIRETVKHEGTLLKSKLLLALLENPKKKKSPNEDMNAAQDIKKFIVDDEDIDDVEVDNDDKELVDEEDDDSDEEKGVCAICDNGGNLVCCEGRCLRSFHPTKEDGKDSLCESLCLSEAEKRGNFECRNCRYKQHQCYACGSLGSSDKSAVPEVFHCVSATCGHFYHPDCVSKLLNPKDKFEAEKLQQKIAAGESFTCPAHMCHVCGESENAEVGELNFAICMRCSMSYHRKCLPREIAFENSEDNEDIIVRAWENLLPNNRILIYCLKHKINERLGTPLRNHVVFPVEERRKKTLDLQSNKKKFLEKRKFVGSSSHENIISKKVKAPAKDSDGKHGSEKRQKYFSQQVHDSFGKPKAKDTSKGLLRDLKSSMQLDKPGTGDARTVLMGEDKFLDKETELVKSNQQKISTSKSERTIKNYAFSKEERSPLSAVDAETKKKIVSMMEKKISSITLDEVLKSHKVPSTHSYSSKNAIDKNLTVGKLEASVEAVRTALNKLDDGGSISEARAVCGPEIINQIIKWRNKLKVYLAPFLHGMRYTSFGRHFTKVDKLQEIVDKLHWYVKNDDMIVDFACGANDFSWLMKEKLYQVGKRCSFKNYDVIRPKNDFSYEKRDWMTVRPKELPGGSKLIMGLNPPFGVKGGLANMFIDKAIEFKPKLLILIVPEETERLDEKKVAYDLIWEDESKLSGKSFYLPGSIDVNDNQMEQWNVKPPRLYLWSRPNWTAEHRAIASEHGHLPTNNEMKVPMEENHNENQVEVEEDAAMDTSPDLEGPVDISKLIREYGGISGQHGLSEGIMKKNLTKTMVQSPKTSSKAPCLKLIPQPAGAGFLEAIPMS
ncbi:hypothetical protein Sjap_002921 [Stephania japonica]|uniref:Zinc finger PHD-type domain-containing protein n=1 Tax=Stephania japonica TaxID=461633 RepID=A0AAP0PWK6_9MAGN